MKTKLGSLVLTCGLVAGFGMISSFTNAQEEKVETQIEIINQDGEKVSPVEIQIRQKQDQASAKATARAGVSVENKDGKIIIVDADGTKREIDVQGAQSIIVNQSVKSIMKDGEEKTESFGKAIIIGPDGKRQEIELGGPLPGGAGLNLQALNFPGFDGVIKVDRLDNKFMIGINCEPISEALSAQLKLESGTGLVVNHVGSGTPAETAEVQLHDILMFADDRQLVKQSDLVEAVQTAGKEKSKLTLTVVRAGKEIGIDITPTERPAGAAGLQQRLVLPNLHGKGFDMKFKQMGPGVIIGDNLQKELELNLAEQMKEMRAQMEEMKKQLKEQLDKENDGT